MTCESLPISLASSEQLRHQASLLPEDKRTIYSGFHADHLWRTRSFLSNSHPFLSTYGRPEYPPLARDHGTCFGQRGVSKHDLHRDWRGWAMPWSFYCQHEMNRFWAAHWLGQTWMEPAAWGQGHSSQSAELSRTAPPKASRWTLFICHRAKANCSHYLTSFLFPFL